MNIATFIMVTLYSNTIFQTILWSYKGKKREKLKQLHNISNLPTLWTVFDYFIDKDDKVTCLSQAYPNLFNLI